MVTIMCAHSLSLSLFRRVLFLACTTGGAEGVDSALADDNRTAELQRKSTEGGIVQQNNAKAELAQHLSEDPLPLRKAKITLEAATKAAEGARQVAEEARGRPLASRGPAPRCRGVA
jgi:hypothetical protein